MTKFSLRWQPILHQFAQRIGVPQLTEEHGDELAPAGETSSMTLPALCWRTADSNSETRVNCKVCERILQTRITAEPP